MKIVRKNTQSAICPSDYIYPNTPRTLGYTMVYVPDWANSGLKVQPWSKITLLYAINQPFWKILHPCYRRTNQPNSNGALLGPYVFSKKN